MLDGNVVFICAYTYDIWMQNRNITDDNANMFGEDFLALMWKRNMVHGNVDAF